VSKVFNMKKKNTVLILGVISILILISVQVFIVRGIWKQKDEMFALRYTLRSKEALNFINRRIPGDGFDTVRYILGKYSDKANREIHGLKDPNELEAKKREVFDFFTQVLNKEQDFSDLLSAYFERRGFEKKFNFTIVINSLEMISDDTVLIYHSQEFDNRLTQERSGKPPQTEISRSKILVNWFRMEDNNYRLFFEYYIDFSDKQKLLLKETSMSFALSILSILVVIIIFMVTYRNLKEEKRLSDLKTDFINNMTHELKTPLSTITVAGKTLEMEQIRKNDEKILETARLIGKQSIHLNQLINMILEISMWERTQFELDKKPVDIEEVMNDITDFFRTGCGNCATLNRKYNFNGTKVDLDIVYFTTMVNNLLANAVKYSDREPEITIEGFTMDHNVMISITDNGIGINKTDQKHIFDKFYRASTGNIHKFKGLGLGLYYVKRIAQAHGGEVSVYSKPGKGSTFTITLPY
jgi:two-component system, OmpR family, phosphate regulon sensor histidine kinase PhoR